MYADALEATIRSLEKERDEAKEKVQKLEKERDEAKEKLQKYAEENKKLKSQLEVCLVEKEELKNQLKAQEITQASGGSGFDSLNDDTLGVILELVGKKSYYAYGGINKRCRVIYLSKNLPKETFLYGYAPLSVIQEKCVKNRNTLSLGSVAYGVLRYNRRDVLEWAFLKRQEHPCILNQIFNTAAGVGRFDILNELYDRSKKEGHVLRFHKGTLSSVAYGGKLDTLKWIDARSNILNERQVRPCAKEAARGGHLNILLWLQTKLPFDKKMKRGFADYAAIGGHLDILKWLQTKLPFDVEMKGSCAYHAAVNGHLDILKWLGDDGCSFDDRTSINFAAENGHLNVLEWLHVNGFSFGKDTFTFAACGGHMHVLEWLRDINCPWDPYCYGCAAMSGHVYVLEWLKNNNCPRGDAKIEIEVWEEEDEELEDDVKIWLFDNFFSYERRRYG